MAIQKSSRTSRIACRPAPSHWRRARTSSPSTASGWPCSHCSNWSRTMSTLEPPRAARPSRIAAAASARPQPAGRPGNSRSSAASRRASVPSACGLDVDRPDPSGQPGDQPGLHERRLAAARRPVDQPDGERPRGVGLLDPATPGADRLGQAVAVARAGDQPGEEVGVLGVERAEPLRDDRDGRQRRGRPPRRGDGGPGRAVGLGRRRALEGQPALEVVGQLGGRLVAVGHPLRQALQADPLQLAGDRGLELPGRLRVGREDRAEDPLAVPAAERQPARQAEVEDHAQGPDVGPARRAGGSRRGPARAP